LLQARIPHHFDIAVNNGHHGRKNGNPEFYWALVIAVASSSLIAMQRSEDK
jgi:hypothetical protein